ncbi:MAG: hypothetical protein FJ148_28585 [Deltaproteobacteria bacterium]|nr:hypothetical protein [Deltaproteobacteria bacterium]
MLLRANLGLAVFAMACCLAPAPAQEPVDLVPQMVAAGASVRTGKHDAHGTYAVVVVPLYSADAPGMARSRQQATHVLGEFLGVEVSSSVENSYSEKVGSTGAAEFSSYFRSQSSSKVQRAIAGMQSLQVHGSGDNLHMAFLLSANGAAGTVHLAEEARERALAPGQVVTVESLGVAPLRGGDEQAEVLATAAAKQEALEMVMGVSLSGYSFALRDEEEAKSKDIFRQAMFATTSGCIERFAVLSKGRSGATMFAVRIRADVSPGKLLDNYRAHLEVIGSPRFAVRAGADAALRGLAEQHFLAKGFRILRGDDTPDWTIELDPTYTQRQHPARVAEQGVQCALAVRVRNQATGELLAGVQTAGDASDFQPGGEARQKARACAKAFRGAAPDLEKQLADGICRLAREGREVHLVVATPDEQMPDTAVLDQLQERWRTLPGVRLVRVAAEGGRVLLVLRSPLRSASLPAFFAEDLAAIWPGHDARVEALDDTRIDLRMTAMPAKSSPTGR